MIPAIAAALSTGDVAGSAASASSNEEAGTAFGNAVKNAGRGHAERHPAKKNEADNDVSEPPAKGRAEHKRARASDEDEGSADAGSADASTVSPGDILGRLLGVAGLRDIRSNDAALAPGGDGQGAGEELQERVIISTVADLAGATASEEAPKGPISLRILKMETHFEPRLDGATLVDPEAAAETVRDVTDALALKADKDGVSTDRTVRKGFEEILQSLGRSSGEPASQNGAEGRTGGEDRRWESSAAANKSADKASSTEAFRSFPAAPAEDGAKPASTTGQIISSQVAERIVEAFASDVGGPNSATSSSSQAQNGQLLRMTAGGAALKTLSIQLQPQDLGRLDVSMRLVDGRLSVELAASEPSTAQALASDRHTLRKLLEHAGFALDDAAITIVARDVAQVSQTGSSGTASNDARNGASDQGQGRSFEGSGRQGEGGSGSSERRRDAEQKEILDRRTASSAGGVFL